jgi:8-oxo-dGTP diphosphatase
MWSLPGGHVEFGESARAAALRELREETGVEADLSHLLGLYEILRPAATVHFAIACYLGRWTAGEAVAGSDAMEVAWARPSELHRFDFVPNILDAIGMARGHLGI